MFKFLMFLGLLSLAGLPLAPAGAEESVPFEIENVDTGALRWSAKAVVLESYDSRRPPRLKFKGTHCKVDGKDVDCAAPFDVAKSPVRGIQRRRVDVRTEKGRVRYDLQLFPDEFPSYRVEGASSLKYPILLAPIRSNEKTGVDYKSGHLLIVSPVGDVLFYKRVGFMTFDFKPHLVDGQTNFSFARVLSHTSLRSMVLGDRFLLDGQMNTIDVVKGVNIHDFVWLGKDEYVWGKEPVERDREGRLFENSRVVHVKGEKTAFDFGISDLIRAKVAFRYPTKDRQGLDEVDFPDVINSWQLIGREAVLVGLHNNGAVMVDRKTKKVKWVFGGPSDQFGLSPEIHPYPWHSPVWDPERSSLYVFDNGLGAKDGQRVTAFKLDVAKKKILSHEIVHSGGFTTAVFGSVERDGEVFSIGLASQSQEMRKTTRPPGQPLFVEVTGGRPTMKIVFQDGKDFVHHNYKSYRLRHGDFVKD